MTTYTTINGNRYDNTLIGTDPNVQYTINGRNGDDIIVGNMLEDILHGNAGDDYIYGDTQFLVVRIILPDFVDFVLPIQNMVISLGANDVITGNADNDHLYGDMGLIDSIYQMEISTSLMGNQQILPLF